jgi:predicted phosphodiesterase
MRYAIVSDVHGNFDSLKIAMAMMEPDDRVISLGDMVGYGPNPNECVELLRDRCVHAVLGNHDLAATENYGVEYFNDAAREAIAWTQTVLNEESRKWLNTLPYELRLPEFLLVHGAPVNYFEYVLDKRTAASAFDRTDAPLVFIGHTHIAEYWVKQADGSIGLKHMQHGGELELDPNLRYIIDVGSVGQPRDLNPEASFVFYEPEKRRVEWLRYPYPIDEVQHKIHACHLPGYLADRLKIGR